MNQKNQVSPEDQYLGVDPHNIIRMQIEIAIEALLPAAPVFANTELDAATFADTTLLTVKLDSLVSVGDEGNVTVYVDVFVTDAIV